MMMIEYSPTAYAEDAGDDKAWYLHGGADLYRVRRCHLSTPPADLRQLRSGLIDALNAALANEQWRWVESYAAALHEICGGES